MRLEGKTNDALEKSPQCGRCFPLFSQQGSAPPLWVETPLQLILGPKESVSTEELRFDYPRGDEVVDALKRPNTVTEEDTSGVRENRPSLIQGLDGLRFTHEPILA